MKKYELTNESIKYYGRTLYRIRALRDIDNTIIDFADVKAGDLGGFIEKEGNLSHEGNCWIYNGAYVYNNAKVFGNAMVFDNADVFGKAKVYGNAKIMEYAKVFGNAMVFDNAEVYGNTKVFSNALVFGEARVYDNALVFSGARVYGNAKVFGEARVSGDVHDNAEAYSNDAKVSNKDILVMNASGKMINPFDLKDSDFDPKIIARTLSRTCRFWGQTSEFYSVAQHCLAMVEVFSDINLKRWALLHEVFEGLTGMDIPTPIKHNKVMSDYRKAEEKALIQAAEIFGLDSCIPNEIKVADKKMLVTEALQYMNTQNYDWTKIAEPYNEEHILKIVKNPMSMKEAEAAFLFCWGELFNKLK